MVGGWEGFGTEGRNESGFGVSGFGGRRVGAIEWVWWREEKNMGRVLGLTVGNGNVMNGGKKNFLRMFPATIRMNH